MSDCLPIKIGAENESVFNNFIYVNIYMEKKPIFTIKHTI